MTDDRAYFDFSTASETSVPTEFYGNYFCFNKKGGGLIEISAFNPADIDWTATCGASCDDSQKPSVTDVNVGEIAYNSAVLTITANDNIGVTRYVVKNGDVQLAQGASNVIILTGLTPSTAYDNIKVFAYDACNNESDAFSVSSFNTEALTYCRFATGHLGQANFGDQFGRILLTIKKVNETTIAVKVEPNNNGTRGIKYMNIIVNGTSHEFGNNDGSGEDLTGFYEISGLASLDFTFNLSFYCNTPNWTTNTFNVTEAELCTEEPLILSEGSEYCGDYGVECERYNGAYAYLKWETTEDGDVVISMVDGVGSTNARFRNNGMGENLDGFTVLSGDEFGTSEAASKYFTRVYAVNGNTFTLQRKGGVVLPSPAKIRFASPYLEWSCTQDGDGYARPTYVYTYAKTCPVMSGYAVSASVNNNTMGSAIVKVGDDEVTSVAEGTEVTFIATSADPALYDFVNWTKGGVVVSTEAEYITTITSNTALVANFELHRNVYCHTEVMTDDDRTLYLSCSQVSAGVYRIRIDGSTNAKINAKGNFNFVVNHTTDYSAGDYDENTGRGWLVSNEGNGYAQNTFAAEDYKTITFGSHYLYFIAQEGGNFSIDSHFPAATSIDWNSTCSDAEAPAFNKAEAEVLNESSVRLKIQATDNWGGLLTYTIAREAAEPIISNHASGEEFTQDVTGLTAGTEYTFTVTVSDGVNNVSQNIVVTPVGDTEPPVMGEARLESNTWNSAIINVAATDNKGVTAYYVVEKAADYIATDGKITVEGLTAATPYTFRIKAKDAAGNISENQAEVSFTTDAHLLAPTAAATAPKWPADQVKAIYSPTYSANCGLGEWGSGTTVVDDTYGKKYTVGPNGGDGGYFGMVDFTLNCLMMEKLHFDIWVADDMSVRFVPIGGGAEQGITKNLTGQVWNSIDIDLSEYTGIDNWGNITQMKLDHMPHNFNLWIGNAYFYRESAIVDGQAPTNVSASVAARGFNSVKITAQAEDNSGAVSFKVLNGENILATGFAATGVSTTITVSSLTPGTNYNLNVIAYDEAGNKASPVAVATSTKALPSPAPTPNLSNKNVVPVFTDAMAGGKTDIHSGGWGETTQVEWLDIAEGDKVFYGQNFNYAGWHSWGADIDATDMVYLHVDVYSLGMTSVNVTPISPGPKEGSATITLTPNAWTSYDVPLSAYDANNIDWANIFQFKFMHPVGGNELLIDNVYFWQQTTQTTPVKGGDEATGGWATFASPVKVAVPSGLTAYKATYSNEGGDEQLVLDAVSGAIPSNEGVLLHGEADHVYAFSPTNAAAGEYSGNALVGCPVRTDITSVAATNDIFCLRYSELYSLTGFFIYSGQYIAAGKAYLPLPKAEPSSAPRRIRFVFREEQGTTGFDPTNAEAVPTTKFIENGQLYIRRGNAVYTIQGVRVK
ncbi:MAG: hypothetical protein SPF23_06320 [Paludibacteraceae bacterium]|nr:hypothetical protein [Paludibacteraceae bacterium]